MFVEVPMSVSIPPNIDAYESGKRSFEGEVPPRSARSVTIGRRMATAAVLLMKPEMGATTPMVAPSWRFSLSTVYREMNAPSFWTMPVRWTPSLRMNIASTVSVAALAKPDSPSSGETIGIGDSRRPTSTNSPDTGSTSISATITEMAVTSTGTGSVANSTRATRMSTKTTTMPGVSATTGGRYHRRAKACWLRVPRRPSSALRVDGPVERTTRSPVDGGR